MSPIRDQQSEHPFAQVDGVTLFNSAEAIVKGVLESEVQVESIFTPETEPFDAMLRVAAHEDAREILRRHELQIRSAPSAARAASLALREARVARAAIAIVPNAQLLNALPTLLEVAKAELQRDGALTLVFEDRPSQCVELGPRQFTMSAKLPCVEPADLAQLRDAFDSCLRLSRVCGRPTGIVVHDSILRSCGTLEARPNRVVESVDAQLLKRRIRRRPRMVETKDVLRIIRRLEFNRTECLPNPGERVPVGFIAIGPAVRVIRHVSHILNLTGRVPLLHVGAIEPIDAAAVSRLLERCDQIVVLEPRPGAVESRVLEVAEVMRSRGERAAMVWGRRLPLGHAGQEAILESDVAVHPSLLTRRILHLLQLIRPGDEISSRLEPDVETARIELPPRGETLGVDAAVTHLRRLVVTTDQWLRNHPETPAALSLDGVVTDGAPSRIVFVEIWDAARFMNEGTATFRSIARDDQPWLVLIYEPKSDDQPALDRLIQSIIPADRTDRVTTSVHTGFAAAALTEALREAALSDRINVLIIREDTRPRFDPLAMERAFADVDRTGFERIQHAELAAERPCLIRMNPESSQSVMQSEPGEWLTGPAIRMKRLSPQAGTKWTVRVRPVLEHVEVIRDRPPAGTWRRRRSTPIVTPDIVHRAASSWRVHIAGYRGAPPGVIGSILLEAGRRMGYSVQSIHDESFIGRGRRSWVQILFTRPGSPDTEEPLVARTPFGEADLLLAVDPNEGIRAITADPTLRVASHRRTHVVFNTGVSNTSGERVDVQRLSAVLGSKSPDGAQSSVRMVEDFRAAARAAFLTDRVTDLAMLGTAYQLGLIPISPEAMEGATRRMESSHIGRVHEVIQFGRQSVLDPRLIRRQRSNQQEDPAHLVRRAIRSTRRTRWLGAGDARRFRELIDDTLSSMPGLAETDAGRVAQRDLVNAIYRCHRWGGSSYAEQFARRIIDLYHADRGETGRALTRYAILPLATAMLIRDAVFIATVTRSHEHKRFLRRLLNIRHARGDRVKRRFLTRVEFQARLLRVRIEVRTSDWPAACFAFMRLLIPAGRRGTRSERAIRRFMTSFVEQAARDARSEYPLWQEALLRLHQRAVDDELWDMAIGELQMLVARPDIDPR